MSRRSHGGGRSDRPRSLVPRLRPLKYSLDAVCSRHSRRTSAHTAHTAHTAHCALAVASSRDRSHARPLNDRVLTTYGREERWRTRQHGPCALHGRARLEPLRESGGRRTDVGRVGRGQTPKPSGEGTSGGFCVISRVCWISSSSKSRFGTITDTASVFVVRNCKGCALARRRHRSREIGRSDTTSSRQVLGLL
jgi:hypothetical protein